MLQQEIGMIEESISIKLMEDSSACIAQVDSGIHHVRNAERYGVTLRLLQECVASKEIQCLHIVL